MFSDVFYNVNWDRELSGTYFHKLCRLHVADERRLNQVVGLSPVKTVINQFKTQKNAEEDVPCASESGTVEKFFYAVSSDSA